MDARVFKKQLTELQRSFSDNATNSASYNLRDCERCSHCVFCENCDRCYRCTYCQECVSSSHLTHCERCTSSHHTANSVDCTACSDSAYLIHCTDCSECNYCFGCVGLARKDFHILNEPYGRSEYFEIVNKLKKQMRV